MKQTDAEAAIEMTTEQLQETSIKEGEVVDGAESSVGPDNLPTFEWFLKSHPELADASFTKSSIKYIRELVLLRGSPVVNCNGELDGASIVATFTSRSMEEIASKLSLQSREALPFMFDVMETGNLVGIVDAPKASHLRRRIAKFAYFSKSVRIRSEDVQVQVDVAIMNREAPPAKPYVVGIKKAPTEGALWRSPLSFPLVGGGFSEPALDSNIAENTGPLKAIAVEIRATTPG